MPRDETTAGESTQGAVSFINDVLPVLTKAGCNQGTCHGGAGGKGGFRLSLRGFAPEEDYIAIVREEFGRRIDRAEPEHSLIVAKPTLAIPHQGGHLIQGGSRAHRILTAWIESGAPGLHENDPHVTALVAEPAAAVLEPGERFRPKVVARFSDGTSRDVTPWARWDVSDAAVARVNEAGEVIALSPGTSAASAAYQSLLAAAEITVPFPAPAAPPDYATLGRAGYIDRLVIDTWRSLRLWPSPLADDATLYRRMALDITGTLPTPAEAQAYQADPRADKRARAVDELLSRPEFADHWAQKWEDIFRASREWIGEKSVWVFDHYLRDAIRRNVPWNVVARELIAGSGDSTEYGPANFYRLQKVFNEAELWPLTAAETTAQTFLGVRLQCARCHNHPFDRWTQADYYGMVSFFARTSAKTMPEGNVIVYERDSGEIAHPRLGRALPPKPPSGPVMPEGATQTRREFLADWATSRNNPFFARATANRIWRHFMGRGLVEPVDDLRASNPASNPKLLDALADDLIAHQFDVRHLMRQILLSNVYALSSTPTADNKDDHQFYSHWYPKRLTAEELLDALTQATGVSEKFAGLPERFRAQQLPDTKVSSAFLDMFGRPLRRSACECERIQEPNLAQALELMHGEAVEARVRGDSGLAARLIAAGADDAGLLDAIYWRSLGRAPRPEERESLLAQARETAAATDPAGVSAARREFWEDVLWAVLNSKEFVFNH